VVLERFVNIDCDITFAWLQHHGEDRCCRGRCRRHPYGIGRRLLARSAPERDDKVNIGAGVRPLA
jgi:hypothetical protein